MPQKQKETKAETKPSVASENGKNKKEANAKTVGLSARFAKNAQRNKKILIVVLLVVALGALVYSNRSKVVVATVNGKPLTRLALIQALEKQAGKQALEALVTQELIKQAALKQGISVTPEALAAQISEIETNVLAQGSTLDAELEAQGMTRKSLEEQLEYQILLDGLTAGSVSEVTDAEIEELVGPAIEAGQEDTPELRQQAAEQIRQTKQNQAIQDFLTQERAEANVVILAEF